MQSLLLDAAGHRRSPATMPGYHRGRSPHNKGEQYPADPPTVEEIVAVAPGPLAMALEGMEADVRDAIGERAMQSGTKAAASEDDGIVFEGSVLIGSGHKAAR
jgi:hypothetical protein